MQKIIFSCLILSIAFQLNFAQEKSIDNSCNIPVKVVFSSVDDMAVGHIFLLVEPKYFTVNDLRKIFICNSSKYPKPIYLKITALSDKKKLKEEINHFRHPPDDEDFDYNSNLEEPITFDYYRADYVRNWNREDNKEESFLYGPNREGKRWRRVYITTKEDIKFQP